MVHKMMRRRASMLAALVMVAVVFAVMSTTALAAEGDSGTTDIWVWKELADGTLEIMTCVTPEGSLILPDKLDIDPTGAVDERDVTQIGSGAFGMASDITAISLPATLKSIGENAFISCSGLQSIAIPTSVGIIGNYAFASCINLEAVTLQDGLQTISSGAFSGCTSLTSVTVPDTVTSIGTAAFSSCTNLESVTFPSNPAFTFISSSLFDRCTTLGSIVIPGTVTSIGDSAFSDSGITSITIPANVSSIGDFVFASCLGLTSIQVNPANTHFMSDNGVLYNADRTILVAYPGAITGTFTVPGGVTNIAIGAFAGCVNLTGVTLTDDIEGIGMLAFAASGITNITIPQNVTDIGMGAFMQCADLTKAVFLCPDATLGVMLFNMPGIGADGIYGFAGSTAQTYATANSHPFHTLYTVSFDCGEGSAVGDVYVESGYSFAAPADPTRAGFVFTGWYTDEALTDLWDFDTDTVTEDMELHAGWAPVLTLAIAPANGQIYVGGRATVTPNVEGGTWAFDEVLLSRDGNTFTGLKAGTARVTYTAGAQSAYADINIIASELPATGQDFTPALWLLGFAVLAGGAAIHQFRRKGATMQ